jgi:hypothetical protein
MGTASVDELHRTVQRVAKEMMLFLDRFQSEPRRHAGCHGLETRATRMNRNETSIIGLGILMFGRTADSHLAFVAYHLFRAFVISIL